MEVSSQPPGNAAFGGKYEFVVVVRHYFGTSVGRAFELTYNLGLLATIVASCMLCLQVTGGGGGAAGRGGSVHAPAVH